jgi:hypothetical protein
MIRQLCAKVLIACIFASVPFTISGQLKNQKVEYKITALGMNVGKLHVNEQSDKNNIFVEVTTDFEVKFIITYRVKLNHNCIYKNGELFSSQIITVKNGKVDSNSSIIKKTNYYLVVSDKDSSKIYDRIDYSGGLTYLHEPKQNNFIYFEKNGEKKSIKSLSNGNYQVLNSKNAVEREFEYKDGILNHAKMILPVATIYLNRIR